MEDENSARVFRALADPTRRQILQDLQGAELTAGEVASRFTISGPSISRHLSILKAAGLVAERRQANRIFYSLVGDRLANSVGAFLSAVCPEQVILRKRRARREQAKARPTPTKCGELHVP
jgi:DNA-binding transcriptional ArsR family regulator